MLAAFIKREALTQFVKVVETGEALHIEFQYDRLLRNSTNKKYLEFFNDYIPQRTMRERA